MSHERDDAREALARADERAELEAWIETVPLLARSHARGDRFAELYDRNGNRIEDEPIPSDEEIRAVVSDDEVQAIIQRAFATSAKHAAARQAAKSSIVRRTTKQPRESNRASYRPAARPSYRRGRWVPLAGRIAAAIVVATSIGVGGATIGMHLQEQRDETSRAAAALAAVAPQPHSSTTVYGDGIQTAFTAPGEVHGFVMYSAKLMVGPVGSAADSSLAMALTGIASFTLDARVATVATACADLTLVRGGYTLNATTKMTRVYVDSGLATVRSKGVTTVVLPHQASIIACPNSQ